MKKERVESEITAESPQDNEFVSDAFQEDQINEEDLKKEMEMLGVEDGKFKDEGMMIAKLDRTSRAASLILAWSHTFVEIDHEIISTAILSSADQEGMLSVTSESMCMKHWLFT